MKCCFGDVFLFYLFLFYIFYYIFFILAFQFFFPIFSFIFYFSISIFSFIFYFSISIFFFNFLFIFFILAFKLFVCRLLGALCQLESVDIEQEVCSNCVAALCLVGNSLIRQQDIMPMLNLLKDICSYR